MRIEQFEFDVRFGLFLQVVVERCAVRRIFSDSVAAAPGVPHARSNRGARREQVRFFAGDGDAGLAQRADVIKHPERAAMSGNHQIVAVDDEIVDRSRRQVELQRLPVCAVVKRSPRARFRAGIEEAFALGIFAHSMNVGAVGKASGDG